MNYPVWNVFFGSGLLIAMVAILHVFVSHFAVGGGLFLVLTERKARRDKDLPLLGWLKSHTKFFVLATVVWGAVSGVGIWLTIGLINPTATSNLIHAFVWGWAIEWVFFFLEITAALLYFYGWDKLDPRLHQWYGWIYFISAYASLLIINGILTFMLTSGKWVENHQFWTGFFNPTYLPATAFRTLIAMALAGVYALITASRQKDTALKTRIVRWSVRWIVPSLLLLPAAGWWYIHQIPTDLWASARGPMPTATHFALLAVALFASAFALSLVAAIKPARLHIAFSLVVALVALGAMGSFEFVREAIRKPYVIGNYLYANSLYSTGTSGDAGFNVDAVSQVGVLQSAHWVETRQITSDNKAEAGREIFVLECSSCHTPDNYRGLSQFLTRRNWTHDRTSAIISALDLLHNGVMPPFAGTDAERDALATYLDTVHPVKENGAVDGQTVFDRNCSVCHRFKSGEAIFPGLPDDSKAAADLLKDMPAIFPRMPDLKLTDDERIALVQWIAARRHATANTGGR